MKKLLLIVLCLPLLFSSCVNNSKEKISKSSISDFYIISYDVTSKNSDLTSSSGTEVSLNEMTTINIKAGESILFKDFKFTLDNKADGAFNFYSDNGKLMCNALTDLSLMSMPPNKNGLTRYNKGEKIEISGTTLIKINSINFVISNIKSNKK